MNDLDFDHLSNFDDRAVALNNKCTAVTIEKLTTSALIEYRERLLSVNVS